LIIHFSVISWSIRPNFCLQDHHLAVPEIPLEDQQRLQLIPVQLSAQQGWRQLDEQSAWQQFSLQNLEQRQQLLQAGESLGMGEDFGFLEGMGTTDLGKVWGNLLVWGYPVAGPITAACFPHAPF